MDSWDEIDTLLGAFTASKDFNLIKEIIGALKVFNANTPNVPDVPVVSSDKDIIELNKRLSRRIEELTK